MGAPHVWLKSAIEAAVPGVTAWPVEMTGRGDPPYAVYARTRTARELTLADTLDSSPEEDEQAMAAQFGLVVYANSYVQAWDIARLIASAIHKFKGSAYGETIDSCLVTEERDGQAEFQDGSELPTYTVELTVEITWST